MKISTKGQSRFLSQADIPEEGVTVIIASVGTEFLKSGRGEEEKWILHFATGKPMVWNLVNRQTVVDAYGANSAGLIGKPVEIYVDPNVYMGSERTGGIRLRIPRQAAAPIRPATPPTKPTPPAPPPAKPAANAAPRKVYTIEEKQAGVLRGYANAQSEEDVHKVSAWANNHEWPQHYGDAQADAYNAALDRLGVGLTSVGNDIPF